MCFAWGRGSEHIPLARRGLSECAALSRSIPDALVILLEQNYRSTQTILDAAQQVISRNVHRTPKKLFTQLGSGVPIAIHEAYNEDDESQYVIETIQTMIRKREARAADFAIMYRTNAQSRAVEDAFIRAGMPYRLVGATRFYARREIKDVLAYLHLVHNPHNSWRFCASSTFLRAGLGPRHWRRWPRRRRMRAGRRTS